MALTYVATAQALRLQSSPSADGVTVGGYYSEGDGGAATYRWDPTSTLQPNDGTVFAPDSVYTESGGYGAGRYLLVHDGVVNVRQFGAKGDGTVRDFASDPLGRFKDSDVYRQAKRLYAGSSGTPFRGLQEADTWDWAAIQAALIWCGENGVRLEGNSGEYMIRRPL